MAQTAFITTSHKLAELYYSALEKHGATFYVLVGAGTLLTVYLLRRSRGRGRKTGKPLPGPWLPPTTRAFNVNVRQMEDFKAKYGPIFSYRLLTVNNLFLCDAESIREALVGQPDVFAGRLNVPLVSFINKNCGIVFIDGPKWQEHRRFALSVLRSFGFGKNITERIIQDELSVLLEEMGKLSRAGEATFPRLTLVSSVANVISLLVFGERCGTEPDFELLVKLTSDTTSSTSFNSVFVLILFRLILKLPGDYFGIKEVLNNMEQLKVFVDRKVDEHRRTIDWDNERDLIDAYLVEMRKRDAESPNNHTFTNFQVFRVVLEMFIAGMETTSSTLTWALLLMAKYPQVQRRVQAELDAVIGDKSPAIGDRSKLVYTTAVVHEIERYVSLIPFSVAHRVMEDTVLRGYFVAADTLVIPYLFGAHRDPKVWKNPTAFDPSHFYDEKTGTLCNTSNLIPFGVGKRSCLGESLATQELFVFFAGVLQRFGIEADKDHPLPTISEEVLDSTIRLIPNYKVLFKQRSRDSQ